MSIRKRPVGRNSNKLDSYDPPVGHGRMTLPCACGLPLVKTDKACPRCKRSTGR